MRLVVLLCGVIAGIVGLGFGWWGQGAALVDIYRLPTPQFAAAVLAIHAGSAVSISGGLLVLANPRVGGMMMLASATVWLLIVALLGDGLGTSMAALIGIGAGGGLLAFLPSLSRPAYRLERAGGRPHVLGAGKPDLVGETRSELDTAPDAQVEPPAALDARRVILDTSEDHSKPFEPLQWRFEAPDWGPVEVSSEAAPPPPPSPPEPPADPQPRPSREDRNERRVAYEVHRGQIRPLTIMPAPRKRQRGRTIAGLTALGVLVFGLPILLVVDQRVRVSSSTEALAPPSAGETAGTGVAAIPAASEAAGSPAEASVEARLPAGALPEFKEGSIAPEADTAKLPMETAAPLPVVPLVSAAYETPFDYCAAVGDVDEPDLAAIAAGLPVELIFGVREVTKIADAEVLWRCMGEAVWVCAQPPGGAACGKVPTPAERKAYCEAHPDATDIVSAAGRWSCAGTDPVVPGGDQRTIDPRGFDRLAWLGLSKAPKTGGNG